MSSNWAKPGINSVGAYQVSGIPYVTSSNGLECAADGTVVQIRFPRVTRWFQITVSGSTGTESNLRIGFTENGINGLGAITGSVNTGVIDEWGNEVWNIPSPTPSSADQANTHKNYFVLGPNAGGTEGAAGIVGTSTGRLELACTDLFLMAENSEAVGFTIIAGLTGIPRGALSLTGSSGYHGVG